MTKALISLKKMFLFALGTSLLMTSCVKDGTWFSTDSGDANRKTVVKFIGSDVPINVIALDVDPPSEEFVLIEVTRDVNTQGDLNQPLTIKLLKNATLIPAGYTELPDAAYTLQDDINSITFQPGEFRKAIKISLDKSQMDLSQAYALGFSVAEVGAGAVISAEGGNVVYSIGVKNQYDGRYRLNFSFYHPSASPGYDAATIDVEMHTSGPNSVKIFMIEFGGYYHPILSGGSITAFGAQEPEFTINPGTNAVTVQNSFPGAVTFYTMAAGFNSHYDPATKTIHAKFGYNYDPGPVFNPTNNREWTDELIYLGPR